MENNLLKVRAENLIEHTAKTNKPQFFGFLSKEEAAFIKNIKTSAVGFVFFGGHENAERSVLGVFPNNIIANHKAFPITAVTVTFRPQYTLTHRDFLGSLMALGIKRETVGDILIENGRAVIFLLTDISRYVLTQLEKIGRVGVQISSGFTLPLPASPSLTIQSTTVASLRLDNVVAALTGGSRSRAVELINSSLVSVNSVIEQKITLNLQSGSAVTVRGFGKFLIEDAGGNTKKGRIILKYKKY
ncbi:MAG: hypothetical protein IJP26_00080 [Clostridia bacterium]|nr:hypothetical protein [Clostridia bacterium]